MILQVHRRYERPKERKLDDIQIRDSERRVIEQMLERVIADPATNSRERTVLERDLLPIFRTEW